MSDEFIFQVKSGHSFRIILKILHPNTDISKILPTEIQMND